MKLNSMNPLNYFPSLVEYKLDQFIELLNLNQSWLENHLQELIKYTESFPEELQEEMFLDDVIAVRDDLPNLTYSGLFVALFAFIEVNMRQMASWYLTKDELSPKEVREGRFKDVLLQLTKKGAMTNRISFKSEFDMLKKLRDKCNHSGARLDSKCLRSYASLRERKLFSDLNVDTTSGKVEFNAEFMHAAVDWAKECLLEMANELRLNSAQQ